MQDERLVARQRRVGNPMRIAVIVDIHGNMPALEAVRDDIERRDADRRSTSVIVCPDRSGHVEFAICSWHRAVR